MVGTKPSDNADRASRQAARPGNWSWLLATLPALLIPLLLTWQFRHMPPRSDGMIFFTNARLVWTLPLQAEHFWADWLHRQSYVSTGLFGLSYLLGDDPVLAVRGLQLVLFAVAIIAFASICRRVFPASTRLDMTLLTLVFSLTPACLAYFAGVALDFVALAFALAYLAALCWRRLLLAAFIGTAFAFTKETAFFVYTLTLPLVFIYSLRRVGPMIPDWPRLTAACFALPLALRALIALTAPSGELGRQISFCQQPSMAAFLFSPNLERREIHNYLFDLFGLNFQWLLLLPVGLLVVRRLLTRRDPAVREAVPVDVPAMLLIAGVFIAQVYAVTRCPIFNNVKYVLLAMPLYLLCIYGVSLYAFPSRRWRNAFFAVVALSFATGNLYSVDPASTAFYGRSLNEGPDAFFCMNSRTRIPEENKCGVDELIYNLQPFVPP